MHKHNIPPGYIQKLHDDLLVQWHDGQWQRGRIQTVYQQTVTLAGPRNGLAGNDMVLVKNSRDDELAFVRGDLLQVQPEEGRCPHCAGSFSFRKPLDDAPITAAEEGK